ncbi:MAG: flagellar protein FlgN [Thermodesulfobacteriota bacterium]
MDRGSLLELLSMETGMYVKLQSVLEEESKTVISRDYKSLYAVLADKERVLAGLSKASAARSVMVCTMLEKSGYSGQRGLRALIGLFTGRDKAALQGAADELCSALGRVAAMNKSNSLLISESLRNLGRSLDFLEAFFVKGTYQATGLVDGTSLKGSRLRKGV